MRCPRTGGGPDAVLEQGSAGLPARRVGGDPGLAAPGGHVPAAQRWTHSIISPTCGTGRLQGRLVTPGYKRKNTNGKREVLSGGSPGGVRTAAAGSAKVRIPPRYLFPLTEELSSSDCSRQ